MQQVAIALAFLTTLGLLAGALLRRERGPSPVIAIGVGGVVGLVAMFAVLQLFGDVVPDGVEGVAGLVAVVVVSAGLVVARLWPRNVRP